ncbi:MAG: serine/threonine-protein kinase, partial [Gemmatimonadales bacterium]
SGVTAREPRPLEKVALPRIIDDRYRVKREIGRGGMATVYLCTDSRDGSDVALKVLRPEVGSAVVVERFLREIKFASDLNHPQIPKVLGSGVAEGIPYYVMEFINGESLRSRLDRLKQLPVDEAIRITERIIVPTAYAHTHGIVHRDLKPGNILLAGDSVYVLDFGIARAIVASTDDSLTSTGVAVGTPAYMSPEQALADHDVDARSDIYSLACVTYEMIAGIPPFVGATAQAVMTRRFVATPPPLHEVRQGVPPSVEEAVQRALCRAPADRWQSVEEFGAALRATAPASTGETARATLDARRRKLAVAVASTAAVVAVAGAIAWTTLARDRVRAGRIALENWDITKAESEFRDAIDRNSSSPRARLWLGQLLIVKHAPLSEWAPLVLKAEDARADLDPDERLRADALARYADTGKPGRCDGLRSLLKQPDRLHPADFTVPLSLADCLASDSTVVVDPASPSGYRFSSSFEEAASLFQSVIDRNSAVGSAFATVVPRLSSILWTNKSKIREGVLNGKSEVSFVALAVLLGDTISFDPYISSGAGAPLRADAEGQTRLVARNLTWMRSLTVAWTKASPGDPSIQETLSGVLEASGNLDGAGGSALESIRAARLAAISHNKGTVDYYEQMRLASANVRILLRLARFHEARLLADSALSWKSSTPLDDDTQALADNLLSGLLALTGRQRRQLEIEQKYASEYVVRFGTEKKTLSADLGADVAKLNSYAIFGGPLDSLVALDKRIRENIESLVSQSQLDEFRRSVLTRPLSLAVEAVGVRPIASLGPSSDQFIKAIRAIDAGNPDRARQLADSLDAFHAGVAPGEMTMDAVLQEAWLRATLGDEQKAVHSLDRALRGLSKAPVTLLQDATMAAALVRAMQFRADLAAKGGDEVNRKRWSSAAQELWMNADPAIKPKAPSLQSRN